MDLKKYLWTNTTYEYKKSKMKKTHIAFGVRKARLDNEKHTASFNIQHYISDRKDFIVTINKFQVCRFSRDTRTEEKNP